MLRSVIFLIFLVPIPHTPATSGRIAFLRQTRSHFFGLLDGQLARHHHGGAAGIESNNASHHHLISLGFCSIIEFSVRAGQDLSITEEIVGDTKGPEPPEGPRLYFGSSS